MAEVIYNDDRAPYWLTGSGVEERLTRERDLPADPLHQQAQRRAERSVEETATVFGVGAGLTTAPAPAWLVWHALARVADLSWPAIAWFAFGTVLVGLLIGGLVYESYLKRARRDVQMYQRPEP